MKELELSLDFCLSFVSFGNSFLCMCCLNRMKAFLGLGMCLGEAALVTAEDMEETLLFSLFISSPLSAIFCAVRGVVLKSSEKLIFLCTALLFSMALVVVYALFSKKDFAVHTLLREDKDAVESEELLLATELGEEGASTCGCGVPQEVAVRLIDAPGTSFDSKPEGRVANSWLIGGRVTLDCMCKELEVLCVMCLGGLSGLPGLSFNCVTNVVLKYFFFLGFSCV